MARELPLLRTNAGISSASTLHVCCLHLCKIADERLSRSCSSYWCSYSFLKPLFPGYMSYKNRTITSDERRWQHIPMKEISAHYSLIGSLSGLSSVLLV
jgi:hypothetical protein